MPPNALPPPAFRRQVAYVIAEVHRSILNKVRRDDAAQLPTAHDAILAPLQRFAFIAGFRDNASKSSLGRLVGTRRRDSACRE